MHPQNLTLPKEKTKQDYVFLLLLMLFFLDVYSTANTFLILLSMYILYKKPGILGKIDRNSLLLLLFGVFYFSFGLFNESIEFSAKSSTVLFAPFIIYNAGIIIVSGIPNEKLLFKIILLITVSFSAIHLYSVIKDIVLTGTYSSTFAVKIEFMGKSLITRATTSIGVILTPLLIFLPSYLYSGAKNHNNKLLFFGSIFSVLSILSVLRIMTRTPIMLFGLLLLVLFIINFKHLSIVKKVFVIIVLLFLIQFLIGFDFASLEMTRGMFERFQEQDFSTSGSRTFRWQDGLFNIVRFPFGGEPMAAYGYYHNVWLDIRKIAGIIPMFLFAIFFVKSVLTTIKLYKSKVYSQTLINLLISLNILISAYFFLEPILEGVPLFFYLYFLLIGITMQMSKGKSRNIQIRSTASYNTVQSH